MEVKMARIAKTTSDAKSSSKQLELQGQIGFSAGEIYNFLATNNGEATFTNIKKNLDLDGNFAELGLGWLAREDKIELSKKGASVSVRLK
jgi:hypothetical protein